MLAWRKAARGKRGTASVARFEYRAEEQLADLREHLLAATYRPGAYLHYRIKDPKRRKISAIRFRDRVIHHALCTVIEPRFERLFIPDSYANRVAKGTHQAVDRLQGLDAYHAGEISGAAIDTSIQGWINHVRHADTWGLRRHVLDSLVIQPAEHWWVIAARQEGSR